MPRSADRILTTHTGSLPRPPGLEAMLLRKERGELEHGDAAKLPGAVAEAVAEAVRRQVGIGLEVVNDGEMGRYAYATYARERLTGIAGEDQPLALSELAEFPKFAERIRLEIKTPACTGPVAFRGAESVAADIANLKDALRDAPAAGAFMTASSPGIMARYMPNRHHPSQGAYLYALADAMSEEYEAVAASGLLLQVDCPDLALGRHFRPAPLDAADFRKEVALHVEVLNHALRNIPPERTRLHLCWGNYESPHHHDIELHEIFDLVVAARPAAILLEAANPRHAHEHALFETTPLPDDKILVPGVIDTCTNYVEHPEAVAQRTERYARLVGRERVMAGTDCGFASFATLHTVDPDIAWRKLEALVEGAAIASERLWRPARARTAP